MNTTPCTHMTYTWRPPLPPLPSLLPLPSLPPLSFLFPPQFQMTLLHIHLYFFTHNRSRSWPSYLYHWFALIKKTTTTSHTRDLCVTHASCWRLTHTHQYSYEGQAQATRHWHPKSWVYSSLSINPRPIGTRFARVCDFCNCIFYCVGVYVFSLQWRT